MLKNFYTEIQEWIKEATAEHKTHPGIFNTYLFTTFMILIAAFIYDYNIITMINLTETTEITFFSQFKSTSAATFLAFIGVVIGSVIIFYELNKTTSAKKIGEKAVKSLWLFQFGIGYLAIILAINYLSGYTVGSLNPLHPLIAYKHTDSLQRSYFIYLIIILISFGIILALIRHTIPDQKKLSPEQKDALKAEIQKQATIEMETTLKQFQTDNQGIIFQKLLDTYKIINEAKADDIIKETRANLDKVNKAIDTMVNETKETGKEKINQQRIQMKSQLDKNIEELDAQAAGKIEENKVKIENVINEIITTEINNQTKIKSKLDEIFKNIKVTADKTAGDILGSIMIKVQEKERDLETSADRLKNEKIPQILDNIEIPNEEIVKRATNLIEANLDKIMGQLISTTHNLMKEDNDKLRNELRGIIKIIIQSELKNMSETIKKEIKSDAPVKPEQFSKGPKETQKNN